MTFSVLAYILFTFSLVVVLLFIIVYYYNPRRKGEVEKPKYRMLESEKKPDR